MRKILRSLKYIYFGEQEYMYSKLNWYLYKIFKGIRYIYGIKIRKNKSTPKNITQTISLDRIEYYLDKNKSSSIDKIWDLLINKLNISDIDVDEYLIKDRDKNLYKQIEINKFDALQKKNNHDDIEVVINQVGEYILVSGLKKVLFCKDLKLGKIPIKILARHPRWENFKYEIINYSGVHVNGAYQQIIHPDFHDLKFHRKSQKRWDLISRNLPIDKGSVLDIGSNWGYFSHKFEDLGFRCTAVERNYRWGYYLERFRDIERKNFDIIIDSIFNIDYKQYDIILALSIFHGFLREKSMYELLIKFLGKIETNYMFFEPHVEDELERGYYKQFTSEEFVNFILENSCLNESKFLGKSEKQRNIYLLSK